jgi:hypothetical protein
MTSRQNRPYITKYPVYNGIEDLMQIKRGCQLTHTPSPLCCLSLPQGGRSRFHLKTVNEIRGGRGEILYRRQNSSNVTARENWVFFTALLLPAWSYLEGKHNWKWKRKRDSAA